MHTTSHPGSLRAIGSIRLLSAVLASRDELRGEMKVVERTEGRFQVWFPNPETQWPVDANGNREQISPREVMNGEVKHARLKYLGDDGNYIQIGRAAALEMMENAEASADLAYDALSFEKYEDTDKTHGALIKELETKLRKLGLDPEKCVRNYRG